MTNNDFTFYSRADYFRQLIQDIHHAQKGERVAVIAMAFNPAEPLVLEIAEALASAAVRGVRVNLIVDAYNFLIDTKMMPGPLWHRKQIPEKLREPFRSQLAALQRIDIAGGTVTITNTPSRRLSLPQGGRSHIKGAVINDKLYVGGCNLTDASHIDIMTCWHDVPTADWLYAWLQRIVATEQVRTALEDVDAELDIDAHTRLLIDAGVPKQSLIYDEALALIDAAKEWLFITCQFFPGGKTAKHLLAAEKRGVQVEILYSHPRVHGTQAPLHHLHILRERSRLPARFFHGQLTKESPKLHAKVLATDQGALVGSHNYVSQGVNLGTAEIALLCRQPAFAVEAVRFMKQYIR